MRFPHPIPRYADDGTGSGFSVPLCRLEHGYNILTTLLLWFSMLLIGLIPAPVLFDIVSRSFFSFSFTGVTELETLALVLVTFGAMPYVTATRGHIVIDMLFNALSPRAKESVLFFSHAVCAVVAVLLAVHMSEAAMDSISFTPALYVPDRWFMLFCAFSLALTALGMVFQALHIFRAAVQTRRTDLVLGLAAALLGAALLFFLPHLYKAAGLHISRLALGVTGFIFLFALLFLRVPIGLAMCAIGCVGLLVTLRSPAAAWSLASEVPYKEVANFVLVAIPMFMLMGEITSFSGISRDMFHCANMWLGRMPGGLACASVGGCAGFGAICGDSMTTVITMSTVALPQMRENKYAPSLSCGALAAGGTLGILIPPSMGFVFYSIITEESVGRLFVAGIVPGVALTCIFIAIIIVQVLVRPELAPASPSYPLKDKIRSLLGLIPMIGLFVLVVGGILQGWFTPGEGGAIGAVCGLLYAAARRKITGNAVAASLRNTALMTGKVFVIMVGVYVFGAFLATSRVPSLLAGFVTALDMNRYAVLAVVIAIYIALGCVMNIIPMMLLTLPSIYPTMEALGFNGIWFGVITVIVMEMGMITPPVGLNVFTMSSLAPDIPMGQIFKGVMPFFCGMIACVLLVVLFPQLALWLPDILM